MLGSTRVSQQPVYLPPSLHSEGAAAGPGCALAPAPGPQARPRTLRSSHLTSHAGIGTLFLLSSDTCLPRTSCPGGIRRAVILRAGAAALPAAAVKGANLDPPAAVDEVTDATDEYPPAACAPRSVKPAPAAPTSGILRLQPQHAGPPATRHICREHALLHSPLRTRHEGDCFPQAWPLQILPATSPGFPSAQEVARHSSQSMLMEGKYARLIF
jgi:hypothetical protein